MDKDDRDKEGRDEKATDDKGKVNSYMDNEASMRLDRSSRDPQFLRRAAAAARRNRETELKHSQKTREANQMGSSSRSEEGDAMQSTPEERYVNSPPTVSDNKATALIQTDECNETAATAVEKPKSESTLRPRGSNRKLSTRGSNRSYAIPQPLQLFPSGSWKVSPPVPARYTKEGSTPQTKDGRIVTGDTPFEYRKTSPSFPQSLDPELHTGAPVPKTPSQLRRFGWESDTSEGDDVALSDDLEQCFLSDGNLGLENEAMDAAIEFYGELTFSKLKSDIAVVALARFDEADTGHSSSGRRGGATNTAAGTRAGSVAPQRYRQGSKRHSGGGEEEDDGEDDGQPKKRRNSRKPVLNSDQCFACPFAKKDSVKYQQCFKYRITRARDVRQHLERCHKQPIYCPCCKKTFKSEATVRTHAEANSCSPRFEEVDGIDRDQVAHLRTRFCSGIDDEVQWFAIFDYLFPNHQPPRSPFIDRHLCVELSSYQNYAASEGTRIMLEVFHSHGFVLPTTDGERTLSAALLQAAVGEGLDLIAARYNTKHRAESSSQTDSNPTSMTPDPAASVHAPAQSETSSMSSGEVAGRRHFFDSPSGFFSRAAPPNSQPSTFHREPSDVPFHPRLRPIYQCPSPRLQAQASAIRPPDADFQEQIPSHILDDELQGLDHSTLPSEFVHDSEFLAGDWMDMLSGEAMEPELGGQVMTQEPRNDLLASLSYQA